jgi:hypothetical protein
MLQLLALAREVAVLKCELTRIRREAEESRRVLSVACHTWGTCLSGPSECLCGTGRLLDR